MHRIGMRDVSFMTSLSNVTDKFKPLICWIMSSKLTVVHEVLSVDESIKEQKDNKHEVSVQFWPFN